MVLSKYLTLKNVSEILTPRQILTTGDMQREIPKHI